MHDLAALINRLRKVARQRHPWAKRQQIEAYRLYDHDIPELRYIVDLYTDKAVVYDRTRAMDHSELDGNLCEVLDDEAQENTHGNENNPRELQRLDGLASHRDLRADDDISPADLIAGIAEALTFKSTDIFLKKRRRMPGAAQYEKLAASGSQFAVQEGKPRYLVNLSDYLDTGLFLDHRPLRFRVVNKPVKRLLNLFCYTGSMSVAAACAGATTTSIDLSATYLDWAQANFKLNQLSLAGHRFERGDARLFLADGPGREPLYDLIFLDPPTFSNSKRMQGSFDIQRDHGILINHALRFLAPGGILYFSTNRRRFQLDQRFSRHGGLEVVDCSESTIPEDFRDRKIHRCFAISLVKS